MGVYIDEDDLLQAMPPYLKLHLMDDDHDGAIDPATLAAVISWAEGRFRSLVGTRYELPGAAADRSYVVSLIADLACYKAHARLPIVSEQAQLQYEETLRSLRDIRDGLEGGDLAEIVDVRPAKVAVFSSAAPVMGAGLDSY